VVDEEGNEVPRDGATVGEIVVRGNVVMKGYYNDPEATALALRGGYFHSGDAAVVHPDGYVDIRDRLKDVIISGGENISSVEVEGVLLRHPAVQEACRRRVAGRQVGRSAACVRRPEAGRHGRPGRSCAPSRASGSRISSARTASRSWRNCPRRRQGRFRNSCCAAAARRSPRSDPAS
jgi:acyl-CoA synthetase (AMP-forming)/AMP-acid ligase II